MDKDQYYESDDDDKIEFTKKNGQIETYVVPYFPSRCNKKRLLCYSLINDEDCIYHNNCTYAHSLGEQIIDDDKLYTYKIILDKNLMNFFSLDNPKTNEIYKNLLSQTRCCKSCLKNKCTGGFNCRNGVCLKNLKLCKNDLLTGECLNNVVEIQMEEELINKIAGDLETPDVYYGCINGHHLTSRTLLPYYKYTYQKENSRKNKYHSIRYLDFEPFNYILKNQYDSTNMLSDSSTDEEVNEWFKDMNNHSDEEWPDI